MKAIKYSKKEKIQIAVMVIIIILLCFADNLKAQQKPVPRIDTIKNKIVLIDVNGNQHEVFKSKSGRSFILIEGVRQNLYRKPENQ